VEAVVLPLHRRKMVRLLSLLSVLCMGATGWGQAPPTVFFSVRLTPQVRLQENDSKLRWYTDTAERSTASLQFYFDNGYAAYISQRLERIANDLDTSYLDEVYIEKVGGWRVGRFYTPFGTGWLLNESVLAVQSPTRFAIGNLPMRVAYAFNGKARQQGLLVRVGTERGGMSVGTGRHFAIYSNAFAWWRLPESAINTQGYSTLYGADYKFELNEHRLQLEWIFTGDSGNAPDTHWFGVRWSMHGTLNPEIGLVYQNRSDIWSWRLGTSKQLGPDLKLELAVRGKKDRFELFATMLEGRL
jgi:hypothetical protein